MATTTPVTTLTTGAGHAAGSAPSAGPVRATRGRRELLAVTVGGVVEGYDWTIYAVMAPYFASQIFPGDDPVAQLLAAYVGFAVGFLARPLGSVLIGRLADRRGRRFALIVSMTTIAAANLVIAVTPGSASIGALAAVIVVASRLVMGISFGGEIPSGAAYVTETAPAARRFRYSAIASLGGVVGPLLAFTTLYVLLSVVGEQGLRDGAWRWAFVVAAAAGLVALWVRRLADESPAFRAEQTRPALWPVLREHKRIMAIALLGTLGATVAFYFGTIYLPVYADAHGVIARADAEKLMPVGFLVMLVTMVVSGRLADRFGAFTIFRAGYALLALSTGPLLILLANGTLSFLVVLLVYLSFFSLVLAQANVIFSQLFPTSIRAIGYGIPYTISAAVFGGTTPAVAHAATAAGRPSLMIWYATAVAIVSLVSMIVLVRPTDVRIPTS